MAIPPETSAPDKDQLLDEILTAFLQAVKEGRAPARQELLDRHPDLAEELAAFFADRDQFDRLAAPLRWVVAAHPPLIQGTAVDNYDLMEEIGHGGMGVIFKARQRSLNRIVALKMLRVGPWATPGDLQRFRTEADAVANLDHPHIVPIYEVGEHQGQPYFTMKLMEGGSLAQPLNRDWWAGDGLDRQRRAAQLLETVARAVHYAHQRGILHRDLKPANILLDADGQPHVTDFGLAKRLTSAPWEAGPPPDRGGPKPGPDAGTAGFPSAGDFQASTDGGPTESGSVLGTPSYMAPEQASGRKGLVTTAADVYSLGTVLYELLTGRPPFRAATPLDTLRQLTEEEPQRPRALRPDIARDLETVCLKCLEKDPRQRYPSALALAEDLQRFRTGEPIQARPVGKGERFWRWCRRKPAPAAAIGLAVLTLGTVVAGSVLFALNESSHATSLDRAALELRQEQEQTRAALEEARRLTEETERQRSRAEESLRQAHRVVNDFYVRVSKELEPVPGMEPLRKELLETALTYYQQFLQQRGQDQALRNELAETRLRVARINGAIGGQAETLKAYQEALALYQDLLRADPTKVEWQRRVAELHHDIGHHQEAAAAQNSYQQAVTLYEQFLRAHPDDLELRRGLAKTYNSQAILHRQTGHLNQARASYQKARAIQEKLVRAYPTRSDLKANLALFIHNMGVFHKQTGQSAAALLSFQEARDLRQELVKARPRESQYQLALAASYRDIGVVQSTTGHRAEGLKSFQQALEIRQRLAEASPRVIPYQSDLAGSYRDLGIAHKDLGRFQEAMTAYQQARPVAALLVRLDPAAPQFQSDLAQTDFLIGALHGLQGEKTQALQAYHQAQDLQEKLVHAYPDNLDYHSELARTLNNVGLILKAQGRLDEARTILEQAIDRQRRAFDQAPQITSYRESLAKHYGALAEVHRAAGRPAAAVAASLERRRLGPANPQELYKVACELGQAATVVGKGQAALSVAEQAERRRYTDLALETLRQAIANGFHEADRLRTEPDLNLVRQRDEFQNLLEEFNK